jgi:hypothetical protein
VGKDFVLGICIFVEIPLKAVRGSGITNNSTKYNKADINLLQTEAYCKTLNYTCIKLDFAI